MKVFSKLRKLTQKISKKAVVAAVLTGAVVGLGASAAVAEFYPNRPVFDYNDPAQRVGSMDGPVFNSFINTPSYGDERAFLDARRSDQTAAGSYKNVLSDVTGGSKEVVVRMYIHNNANQSTNASGVGIARDTKVRIALPSAEAASLRARGYISASNAAMVEDTVDFVDTKAFKVEYVPGSAIIYNNGPLNGAQLSDSIVTDGAPIGYDALNGNLPGCFEYEAVVQIRVKVIPKETPNIDFTKQVRKKGDKTWHKEVAAKPGDTVEWLLTTDNTGSTVLNNVVTRDVLPPHVTLESGSVRWIDAQQDAKQDDKPLFDGGINVGNYGPGGGFYMMFSTKVQGDFDPCEIRVRNLGYVKSDQTPEKEDYADVIITRENCQPEKPVYRCDALELTHLGGLKYRFTARGTAQNATLKTYTFNFGDNSSPKVTDQATVEHTYAQAGQYKATVTLTFDVNGENKTATGPACEVTINTEVPPVTPPTPEVPPVLPSTGPADVAAVFAAVSIAAGVAYRFFVARRMGA